MATSEITIHSETQQWLGESAMWRDDLAIWQKEIDHALGELQVLEDASREYRQELQDHLEIVAAEGQYLRNQEHALANLERGRSTDELELLRLAKLHRENAGVHAQQRQAHERLKKHHHALMIHWSALLKTLGPTA